METLSEKDLSKAQKNRLKTSGRSVSSTTVTLMSHLPVHGRHRFDSLPGWSIVSWVSFFHLNQLSCYLFVYIQQAPPCGCRCWHFYHMLISHYSTVSLTSVTSCFLGLCDGSGSEDGDGRLSLSSLLPPAAARLWRCQLHAEQSLWVCIRDVAHHVSCSIQLWDAILYWLCDSQQHRR